MEIEKKYLVSKDLLLSQTYEYIEIQHITCEVEFETEEEANNFVPPKFCVLDVTENTFYKNINLAK